MVQTFGQEVWTRPSVRSGAEYTATGWGAARPTALTRLAEHQPSTDRPGGDRLAPAVIVGDPRFDELLVSADRAGSFRRAFGVPDEHRPVVLSSTWGRW
ncbi:MULTISPECIES: hypothetical protein [Streptomyces]|uniref:hypothetical protein n=1 Tax=Streptomyces TaxID=1883 RepID=UPI0004C64A43|nr:MULTISPECIES: hypothetical protein [Streptomyces]RPK80081.1 hypothetical protein EES46_31110 [Streptomyces sp. ADI98-10]